MDAYLTNYWPISNGQMTDLIGNAHMMQGFNTTYVADRYGNTNSALNLNGGYTYVNAGYFFYTPQFSISAWVYPRSVGNYARLVDFGNGAPIDNVYFTLTTGTDLKAYFKVCQGSTCTPYPTSSIALVENKWQFMTATFDGFTLRIYINGQLTASQLRNYMLPKIVRQNCYFGKSNFASDLYSYFYVDDMRFYNISLTSCQIGNLMNNTSTWPTTIISSATTLYTKDFATGTDSTGGSAQISEQINSTSSHNIDTSSFTTTFLETMTEVQSNGTKIMFTSNAGLNCTSGL